VRAIAALRHPHLVIMRALESGGFEAELAGGRRLSDLLRSKGPLSLRVALRILLDAMSGLSALHRVHRDGNPLNFVHGEVTPDNIILGTDGVARLVPLVQAHWQPGSTVSPGATGYTSPEKLLGDDFDHRTDVFSAGVLLWEAMMGRPLFHDATVSDIVTRLVGGKVLRPVVKGEDAIWSAELADVVMRALAADPADRWDHLGIMGADIETIAEGRMAKSSELIVLVTGRDVSLDSLSDEVTRPFASISSLSPFANSISSGSDEPTYPNGLLDPIRSDSTEPVAAAVRPSRVSRIPIPGRRRWSVLVAALSASFVVLAAVGVKMTNHTETTVAAPVLAPAIDPLPTDPRVLTAIEDLAAPSAIDSAQSAAGRSAAPTAPPNAAQKPSPSPTSQPPNTDAKPTRLAPKPSNGTAKAKPKDDPFGLMKPVRSKQKDDPFGL
jgi:serine/threonine-protein kinase